MADKKDLSTLPQFLKPERVAEHFKDGMFEFDFDTEEHIAVEGNTVYHVIPQVIMQKALSDAQKRMEDLDKSSSAYMKIMFWEN